MTPQLQTSLCGQLIDLEKRVLAHSTDIEHWFRAQWRVHPPPFYGSVDLRNACFKIAPVDTNLFPGGFNNLSEAALPVTVQALMASVESHCPDIARVLVIPENHTRNVFYLSNVARLVSLLKQAGLNVRVGSLLPDLTGPTPIRAVTPSGHEVELLLEPLVRDGDRLGLAGFDPCLILLNNDLSSGVPPPLQGLSQQAILPPLHAGWASRRKSQHFTAYRSVAQEFAQRLQIDPWLIDPYFDRCQGIDFHARQGEDCLSDRVSDLLHKIRAKYREYDIQQTPFVVVKADAGTYGMGIMTVKDPSEVLNLNRKQRNKMAVGKEGLEVHDVLVQEGVHSFETVLQPEGEAVAEPVVYMVDRFVVGGFYRVHVDRGPDENLNAPGARFVPLAFEQSCQQPIAEANPDATPNRLYLYGVISRLALLGASREIQATHPAARRADSSLEA
ncbi:MAG: glutamate--cysteine ligase [Pseudomonadota bacterium]|jgi:glutamate--cysteine ligase